LIFIFLLASGGNSIPFFMQRNKTTIGVNKKNIELIPQIHIIKTQKIDQVSQKDDG